MPEAYPPDDDNGLLKTDNAPAPKTVAVKTAKSNKPAKPLEDAPKPEVDETEKEIRVVDKKKKKDAKGAQADTKKVSAFDNVDNIPDEAVALAKNRRLLNALTIQSIFIGIVSIVMIVGMPFYQTRYVYHSMTPEGGVYGMTPLSMPNLTDSAIKAWAANAVTEILTVGFGDFDKRLLTQQHRFTAEGWGDFVHVFFEKKIGDTLKKNQLVLTTVPSEDPTITSQNEDEKHVYVWNVSVPVIMTYATNNDVTKATNSTVRLTIVRVPYDESNSGIAIDNWHQ